jgi:hypothetical protein
MATPASATGSGVVPYRLTVGQFRKMIDANVFKVRDLTTKAMMVNL